MKEIIKISFLILCLNLIYYLFILQFECDKKINNNQDLNKYEIFSALEAHSCLWLFGWIIEPNTALICFNKQFNIHNNIISFSLPEDDDVIKNAKKQLLINPDTTITLRWKNYNSKASILYNGSTISLFEDEFGKDFLYKIPGDYKPGIINIGPIKISETVFDYLEKKNILKQIETTKLQRSRH